MIDIEGDSEQNLNLLEGMVSIGWRLVTGRDRLVNISNQLCGKIHECLINFTHIRDV